MRNERYSTLPFSMDGYVTLLPSTLIVPPCAINALAFRILCKVNHRSNIPPITRIVDNTVGDNI